MTTKLAEASRATKIIKFDVAGTKFDKSGIITSEDGGAVQKNYDYNMLIFAYAHDNTLAPTGLTAGYNVLAVNDY